MRTIFHTRYFFLIPNQQSFEYSLVLPSVYALCVEFNSEQPLLGQVNHIIILPVCEIRIEPSRIHHRSTAVKMNYFVIFVISRIYIYVCVYICTIHEHDKKVDARWREITMYSRTNESNDNTFPIIHRIDLWI